jgi:hypothetical protein
MDEVRKPINSVYQSKISVFEIINFLRWLYNEVGLVEMMYY